MTLARPWLTTTLSVTAAVLVTAQGMSAPKAHRARDFVPVTPEMQSGLTLVCQMYPADCRYNADGSIARVTGRRVVSGVDPAVVRHFMTAVGSSTQDSPWESP